MKRSQHSILTFNPTTFKIGTSVRTSNWKAAYKAWGEAKGVVKEAPTLAAIWTINSLTYKHATCENSKVKEIVFEKNSTKKKHASKKTVEAAV